MNSRAVAPWKASTRLWQLSTSCFDPSCSSCAPKCCASSPWDAGDLHLGRSRAWPAKPYASPRAVCAAMGHGQLGSKSATSRMANGGAKRNEVTCASSLRQRSEPPEKAEGSNAHIREPWPVAPLSPRKLAARISPPLQYRELNLHSKSVSASLCAPISYCCSPSDRQALPHSNQPR